MGALKALVFDLDDTLYPEQAYVRSGFAAVARWLQAQAGLPAPGTFAALWSAHLRGDRGRLFNDLLAAHPAELGAVDVPSLIRVYRSHAPAIALYPGMAGLLEEAGCRSLRLALISDGFLEAQRRKVEALGLARWFDPILLTDEGGREAWKPDPRSFLRVQAAFGFEPGALAYIGNNPAKDFKAPRELGWRTVQLRMPGQLATGEALMAAQDEVSGVQALCAWVAGA
jgi:putative hydrolase of the HAD superfamily